MKRCDMLMEKLRGMPCSSLSLVSECGFVLTKRLLTPMSSRSDYITMPFRRGICSSAVQAGGPLVHASSSSVCSRFRIDVFDNMWNAPVPIADAVVSDPAKNTAWPFENKLSGSKCRGVACLLRNASSNAGRDYSMLVVVSMLCGCFLRASRVS